jgi:hypothetical protein
MAIPALKPTVAAFSEWPTIRPEIAHIPFAHKWQEANVPHHSPCRTGRDRP